MDVTINSLLKPRVITPVGLSLVTLLWAFIVSPYTKYGNNWAIYPVLIIALLIISWHLYLIIKPNPLSRTTMVIYGLLHSSAFIYIFIYSLMLISKDSL